MSLLNKSISFFKKKNLSDPKLLNNSVYTKYLFYNNWNLTQVKFCNNRKSVLLTLIIALEVMRKSVALSLTALIFSPPSRGTRKVSSSLRDRCSAAPCLDIRSLHVLKSSNLLARVLRVPWISLWSDWEVGSSSAESSTQRETQNTGYGRTFNYWVNYCFKTDKNNTSHVPTMCLPAVFRPQLLISLIN